VTIAAQGTVAGLQLALQERMETLLEHVVLETKTGLRKPTVDGFDLPPKQGAEVERFPFVIVRSRTGVDSVEGADQNATAVFEIALGTYSDTDDGGLDVLVLIDAIRMSLAAEPAIAGTAYEHVGPLSWETPSLQPRPQWFGFVTTNWQIPRPTRVDARNPMSEV
jgi:hypothetical protein